MDYLLTKHARERITQRNITEEWIARTLDNPTKLEPDEREPHRLHVFAVIPEFNDNVLHIIYDSSVEPIKVITAYFDRTMKGKL